MKLRLYRTEQLRTRLIDRARGRIGQYYQEASQSIQRWVQKVTNRVPNDSVLNVGMYKEVEREAHRRYSEITKNIENDIEQDMTAISERAFGEFSDHLISYGFPFGKYFLAIPRAVVQNILNGTIYERPDNLGTTEFNWGLSKAIWGDNRKTIADIHKIIATGVASGASAMQIAEDIEKYTNPNKDKKRDFDWSKVYPSVKKKIDYNASRLARTLLNHAYQQSFKEAGESNPWIEYYIWSSAMIHGRTCQVCMDLDGNYFSKDSDPNPKYPYLPLDHPNGLCSWTYEINSKNMAQDIRNWSNGRGNREMNRRINAYRRYMERN